MASARLVVLVAFGFDKAQSGKTTATSLADEPGAPALICKSCCVVCLACNIEVGGPGQAGLGWAPSPDCLEASDATGELNGRSLPGSFAI